VDGVEWIDGSVQADLPFKRIATLFNVTNFIVCQVNFHVVPFMRKPHHPDEKSFYSRLFQILEWDVRSRVLNLSRLGLFPRFFGQDISKIFKQKYHGTVTIVPKMNVMQTLGAKALLNPTVPDMEHYLSAGQEAVWSYLHLIKHMLRVEALLTESCDSLGAGLTNATKNSYLSSFRGNRERSFSQARESELLRDRVVALEKENRKLSKLVSKMKSEANGSAGVMSRSSSGADLCDDGREEGGAVNGGGGIAGEKKKRERKKTKDKKESEQAQAQQAAQTKAKDSANSSSSVSASAVIVEAEAAAPPVATVEVAAVQEIIAAKEKKNNSKQEEKKSGEEEESGEWSTVETKKQKSSNSSKESSSSSSEKTAE
jgi:hypothetical protein